MMSAIRRSIFRFFVVLVGAMNPTDTMGQTIGQVTGDIGTTEPKDVSFRIGPVMVASGVTVQRLGMDDNVFDEAENPKRDWHAVITPDLTMYVRTGSMRFTVASLTDFTYYKKFASERGINERLRGRLDVLLGRFRPFVGGATVETRDPPTAEIDLRVRHSEREVMTGVSVEVSPVTSFFGGLTRTEFSVEEGEVYGGVSLDEQLDRRIDAVSAGLRRELTPLTSMQVIGRVSRDRFDQSTIRNSDSVHVLTTLTFDPDALFHGELSAGYLVFEPSDTTVEAYRGLTLGGRIEWPIFTTTRLDLELERAVRYSYEEAEAYYVETGTSLTVTQRVFGSFDVRAGGSYRRLAYGNGSAPAGVDPNDRVLSALAGVGYTLRDESRVGLNYEFTNRESARRRDRLFDRHRLYASWTHKF